MTGPVAPDGAAAHLAAMLKRRDLPQSDPTPAAPVAAEHPVLRSNPPAVQPDLHDILKEIRRDFPITLARLAE